MTQPIVIQSQNDNSFKVIVPQEGKQFCCFNLESARRIADDYADFWNVSVKVKEHSSSN